MTTPQEQWVEIRSDQRNEMLFQPFIIITVVIIIIIVVAVVVGSSFLENVLSSPQEIPRISLRITNRNEMIKIQKRKNNKKTYLYTPALYCCCFFLVVALLILITNVGWLADWTCTCLLLSILFLFLLFCSWLFQYSRARFTS